MSRAVDELSREYPKIIHEGYYASRIVIDRVMDDLKRQHPKTTHEGECALHRAIVRVRDDLEREHPKIYKRKTFSKKSFKNVRRIGESVMPDSYDRYRKIKEEGLA